MSSRLLFLAGLMACIGAGCQDQDGAKLTLSFPHFKPGCIRVNVKDARGAGSELTRDLQDSLATKTPGGQLTVAVLFQEGWGERLTFTATAYEQTCGEGPGFIASTTVEVASQGAVPSVELTFDAVDQDGDGYVSRASGGRDCADDKADVHPGQKELCNQRDDNCDSRTDEGFELVGQQCGAVGSCQAWVCNAEGAASCQSGAARWYRDQDGDGEGILQDSRESCLQPTGYVNNSRDCDDTKAARNSAAKELCNGINDNCDNEVDEGFNVGKACSDGTCGGQFECTTTTQSACKVVKSTWYPDRDRDTHGKQGAAQTFCVSAQPTGYVASSDDCDDTKASVYTGAPELCDGLDNNCDNRTDEGFDVGATCTDGNDCSGTKECTSLTASACKATAAPTQYYVDNDQDGYGGATGPLTCNTPRGYVTQDGDCRDGNPYIRPNAAELCDGEDNDCNPTTSETSVCPSGGASWKNYSSSVAEDWRSVALYASGGVWVVGGDKLHHRKPGQSTFDNLNTCVAGEDVYSIAANPSTGDAAIGGNYGFLARYYPATNTCADKGRKGIETAIRGVHLVPVPGESLLENYLVGINTASSPGSAEGRAVRFFDSIGTGYDNETVTYELEDVHGPSRGTLFAVGGNSSLTMTSRIYRFNPGTGNWGEETVPGGGALHGVWVVNSKLAYAVGNSGTLLTWNGTAWSKVTGAPNENLSAVVAFGTQSIYVTTLLGLVYYYNGTTWMELFRVPSAQLRDIAANNPGDIWVVGTRGARYHWPQ